MARLAAVFVAGLVVASLAFGVLGCKGGKAGAGGTVSPDVKSKMQGISKQVEQKAGKGAAGG
jgi:hypothetical protein